MLLDEALKSAGFTKYLLKKFLIILKLFVTSKWNFISITDQETKAVKNFFQIVEFIKYLINTI